MALVKIQLLKNILINGEDASPNDKNKGVYEVEAQLAYNLIDRKRAVLFGEKVETPNAPGNNKPEFNLDVLKTVANTLGIKYNPQIGGAKLNDKILAELQPKAEELKVDIGGMDALKAYEVVGNASVQLPGQDQDPVEEITEDELKEIAEAAEIEIPENATKEELEAAVKQALEDYASECKLEAVENETIKATWERIKAKLKEND